MCVLDKRGAASSMCETIAASTPSFASRCFWPLHATTAEVGVDKHRRRNGIRRWYGWILSQHDLRPERQRIVMLTTRRLRPWGCTHWLHQTFFKNSSNVGPE